MKKPKYMLISFFVLFVVFITMFENVNAVGFQGGIKYELEFPKEQRSGQNSYYDLDVSPGDTIEMSLKAYNPTEGQIEISIAAGNGLTSQTADLLIDEKKKVSSSYLLNKEFAIKEWIEVPKSVYVGPKETVILPVKLKVPSSASGGVYLGGIMLETLYINNEKNFNDEDDTISVKFDNLVRYNFGIKINVDTKEQGYIDIFELGKGEIYTNSQYYSIGLEMINNNPYIYKSDQLDFTVKDLNGNELFTYKKENFKISPFNAVIVDVPWYGSVFKEEVEVQIKDNNGEIIAKTRVRYNPSGSNISVNKNPSPLRVDGSGSSDKSVILVIAVSVLLVIVTIIFRKRKKKKSLTD
ncbi:DUF916 domain-containing protein (plasmid) [Rossellomorea sp. AcN35-11]|nr:DUF916 domain-containing protein [Rossellomorea aquimaris]WJV31859.1 DUF916 domain-containing protein [Rossellomorea sp. AcN35-11]